MYNLNSINLTIDISFNIFYNILKHSFAVSILVILIKPPTKHGLRQSDV